MIFTNKSYHCFRYLTRFKTALADHPSVAELVVNLKTNFETFSIDVLSSSPAFKDALTTSSFTPQARRFILSETQIMFRTLDAITETYQGRLVAPSLPRFELLSLSNSNPGVLTALKSAYSPPGDLRPEGRRFDNDHHDFREIKILPTFQELLSTIPPYLPANIPSAPHHLPDGTMNRQLDIMFRLLREDAFGPTRAAVKSLLYDLGTAIGSRRKELLNFMGRGGGRWKSKDDSNSVDFNLYGSVSFKDISILKHNLVVSLNFLLPKNFNNSPASKSKKLERGNIVGLLLHNADSKGFSDE